MSAYCVHRITNLGQLSHPDITEPIEVSYIGSDGHPKSLAAPITCGTSVTFSTNSETDWIIPEGDHQLTVVLNAGGETTELWLRQFGNASAPDIRASLDGGQSWTALAGQQAGGPFSTGVSIADGSKGILVIGTVDIGED